MKELYLKLLELLKTIPELKWVDWNNGQLNETRPPIAYPAALISVDLPHTENIGIDLQQVNCNFSIQLVFNALGETNAEAPVEQRESALLYFDTIDKVFDKLQGYKNEQFYPFERTSVRNRTVRSGVTVVDMNFTTSWRERIANS